MRKIKLSEINDTPYIKDKLAVLILHGKNSPYRDAVFATTIFRDIIARAVNNILPPDTAAYFLTSAL